jgi:hypothetical protein
MKRILTLWVALAIIATSFASGSSVVPPLKKESKIKATDVLIPIGKNGQTISLMELSHLKIKELEVITGEKMSLVDKVGFKIAQNQLRHSINADGSFNNRKLEKMAGKAADASGFHLGGFALGFLLFLIGVLIAYLIKDDLKAQRVKWAWIGAAAGLVLWLLLGVII